MSINMSGHIDGVFKSLDAQRIGKGGDWIDGKWVEVPGVPKDYQINVQPATPAEIEFLFPGADRIRDVRKIYVNDGDLDEIDNTGIWVFLGLNWKTLACDNRPWHRYCKVTVVREDDQ